MALRSRILIQHQPRVNKADLNLRHRFSAIWSSRAQQLQIDSELPDFAAVLGLLLGNGLPATVSLAWLTPRSEGALAREFSILVENLELGADPVIELEKLAQSNGSQQLTELCEKLSLSMTRGAPVSDQLLAHSRAARSQIQRNLLKQAGANETKMLIPVIFLILPVTVLFAVFPSMSLLSEQL
jgi:tight adherence protein C